MDTNEPGREPTEPTDAMILAAKIYEWQAKQKYGEETLLHVAVLCDFTGASRYKRAMAEVIEQHMMSGARPMPGSEVSRAEVLRMSTDTLLKAEAERLPDTPAPDEVAQLRAEVARLKDELIDRETECNQIHAEMQEPLTAQRLREHNDGYLYLGNGVEVAIAGTTARVAELDALAWASLYHHQGGHGILGQAIRVALGIGQFDRMTTEQLNIAHKVLGMAPITTAPGGEGGGK